MFCILRLLNVYKFELIKVYFVQRCLIGNILGEDLVFNDRLDNRKRYQIRY